MTSAGVLERLTDLFVHKSALDNSSSDNGREFSAKRVPEWLDRVGVKTLYTERGFPWENGYNESFNGKLCDAVLAGEVLATLLEAKSLIERWREGRNTFRRHGLLVCWKSGD